MVSDEQVIKTVRSEAKNYWAKGDEPVEIEAIRIDERQEDGDIIVKVQWTSESVKDALHDDMIYTVTELDDGTLDVTGPEW
jgi:hypothetical protein